MTLEELKTRLRAIGAAHQDREERARRIFVEERAHSLVNDRGREFGIKSEVSNFFEIPYSNVSFCGSAQLGFSILKNRLFIAGSSDLDIACINVDLFQLAWKDIIKTTRAFSDLSMFSQTDKSIDILKDQILRRGMINVNKMPNSALSRKWRDFSRELTKKHSDLFRQISFAIYMNEHGFCYKQDSVLSEFMR